MKRLIPVLAAACAFLSRCAFAAEKGAWRIPVLGMPFRTVPRLRAECADVFSPRCALFPRLTRRKRDTGA